MLKALFIGGTGIISSGITRALAENADWELTILNRGKRAMEVPENVRVWTGDIDNREAVEKLLEGQFFDVVADFIAFTPEQVKRDLGYFRGKCGQYFFIGTGSAYQKPLMSPVITESTPLKNPYWQYSRDKIACEELLMAENRSSGFPVTIVRPAHVYYERMMPFAIGGDTEFWQVICRMRQGKPVIVPGDGTSLWTLTHNQDFAKGFIGLMGNIHAVGEVVQITTDEVLTWNQIYRLSAQAFGVEARLVHISSDFLIACDPSLEGPLLGDKSVSVMFDNSKLKRLVPGFHAEIRYDQGVRRTADYVLSHPEVQIPNPEFDQWCDDVIEAHSLGMQSFIARHPRKYL